MVKNHLVHLGTVHEPDPVPCLQASDTLRELQVSPTLLENRVNLAMA